MQTRLLETIDGEPPRWLVTADIGKFKKSAQVSIMFPQGMDAVCERPPDGTFEAKLWDLKNELRTMTQILDYGLPQPPLSGSWWQKLDAGVEKLKSALHRLWQDRF
jgi:hypothetical protein